MFKPLKFVRIPFCCRKHIALWGAACALLGAGGQAAMAVIVFRGSGRNLAAPTVDLSQSGWQYEGLWNGFTGTVIGPHQFITATHVGGQVGALFELAGKAYPATGWTHVSNSDMTIWWVDGTFPAYAPLYEKSAELGQPIMMYGRGTARGAAIRIEGETRGWRWGENDDRLSWGKNVVAGITGPNFQNRGDLDSGDALSGGASPNQTLGEMLAWGFLKTGDLDTGSISSGDSGGSVFIKDGATWKLAGVIHGTDMGFRRTLAPGAASEPFRASVFDARGLYRAGDNSLIGNFGRPDDELPLNRCSIGYACRISAHKAEIDRALLLPPRSRITRRFLAKLLGAAIAAVAVFWLLVAVLVRLARRWRRRRFSENADSAI